MKKLSRRSALLGLAALPLTATITSAAEHPLYGGAMQAALRDLALIPPAESAFDFPVTPVNPRTIPSRFRRQNVSYDGNAEPGTIIVDPSQRFLYLIQNSGEAIRYGVGVGKAGFAWSGTAEIRMKRRWPRWLPPEEMTIRDVHAAEWVNGMPGGPDNPLGARALYLFSGGQDTLYRIHGTNDPSSIGKAMSSGCIRMLNEDIADLFDRVGVGTPVIVLASDI
jgi:lipoprotein-anchoring transpeptidase ErfK/SrfK